MAPWPDGGWLAGVQITGREWVREQIEREGYDDELDSAILSVPGDDDFPDWDIFDGFVGGLNAHGDDAADAIDRLWAMVHGEKNPPRRHQREDPRWVADDDDE